MGGGGESRAALRRRRADRPRPARRAPDAVSGAAPYEVLSLDDLERYPAMSGAPVLMPLRRRLGLRAFGLNCRTAGVGEHVIERHFEREGDEELYVVVRGRARFAVGDDSAEVGPATLVHVLPG